MKDFDALRTEERLRHEKELSLIEKEEALYHKLPDTFEAFSFVANNTFFVKCTLSMAKEILRIFPPLENVLTVPGNSSKVPVPKYRINLDTSAKGRGTVTIEWASKDIEVRLSISPEAFLKAGLIHRKPRNVSSTEYIHFPGISTEELREMKVQNLEFDSESVWQAQLHNKQTFFNFYGGVRTCICTEEVQKFLNIIEQS